MTHTRKSIHKKKGLSILNFVFNGRRGHAPSACVLCAHLCTLFTMIKYTTGIVHYTLHLHFSRWYNLKLVYSFYLLKLTFHSLIYFRKEVSCLILFCKQGWTGWIVGFWSDHHLIEANDHNRINDTDYTCR